MKSAKAKAARPPKTKAELERILDPLFTEDHEADPVIEAIAFQASACLLRGTKNPLAEWIQEYANKVGTPKEFARVYATGSLSDLGTVLRTASKRNRFSVVRAILATGQCKPSDIDSALTLAVEQEHFESIRLLLAHGVSDISDGLVNAVRENRPEIAELLLAHPGAGNPNVIQAAFLAAAQGGNVEFLKLFHGKGAPIDSRNQFGDSALVLTEDIECMRFLLEAGANPNLARKPTDTVLHRTRKPSLIRLLCKHGAVVDTRDENGDTALHLAYKRDAVWAARALLECGASPTVKNKEGKTPRDVLYHSARVSEWEDMP